MTEERKLLLKKINDLIDRRKIELLQRIPYVHEIDDGILIRFFDDWGECQFNSKIRFKKFINEEDFTDITMFYFIPKGTMLEKKSIKYINSVICMTGKLSININNENTTLFSSKKMNINKAEFECLALEDSYVITLSK